MAKADSTCSAQGCTDLVGPRGAKGMCPLHYRLNRPPCEVAGCEKPQRGRKLCAMHLARVHATGSPHKTASGRIAYGHGAKCALEGCERPRRKRSWCESHYARWRRTGDPGGGGPMWAEGGRPCPVCDGDTERRQRYCSDSCRMAARRAGAAGRDVNRAVQSLATPCQLCDEPIALGRGEGKLARVDTKFCRRCGRDSADARRLRRYRITPTEYAEALKRGCPICGDKPSSLHVDHDHSCCPPGTFRLCGECTRGLICGPCNRGIGLLRDDQSVLRRAAVYLDNFTA